MTIVKGICQHVAGIAGMHSSKPRVPCSPRPCQVTPCYDKLLALVSSSPTGLSPMPSLPHTYVCASALCITDMCCCQAMLSLYDKYSALVSNQFQSHPAFQNAMKVQPANVILLLKGRERWAGWWG